MAFRVLIADDDEFLLRALRLQLSEVADEVVAVANGSAALEELRRSAFQVFLTDVDMPGVRGDDLLPVVAHDFPLTATVIMTGQARVDAAVKALKAGAFDYLEKPFVDANIVVLAVTRAADHARLKRHNQELELALKAHQGFQGMIGTSPAMRAVFSLIDSVAYSDATVLIEGESGTGKELAARALHQKSPRAERPFVAVNCSALTETLLEAELFGYVKGAFTGADTTRRGLFEAADRGTIFLDEIGHISPGVQVRLLRVLQDGEVRRVGATDTVKVDCRVLAATNADLTRAVKDNSFRQDLYYRLNVIGMKLPPLRERRDDVGLLAQHLLKKHTMKLGKKVERFSDAALQAILSHPWPGNVRELENAVQHAVVLTRQGQIALDDLPELLRRVPIKLTSVASSDGDLTGLPFTEAKRSMVHAFEQRYVREALKKAEGNIHAAARIAGVDRSNFRRLMKEHSEIPATSGPASSAPHSLGDAPANPNPAARLT